MANADFSSQAVQDRSLRITDLILGLDPSESDAAAAARADTIAEFIKLVLTNPSADLTDEEKLAFATTLGIAFKKTNLDVQISADDVKVRSSTGTNATIPSATDSEAGVMAAEDHEKLGAYPDADDGNNGQVVARASSGDGFELVDAATEEQVEDWVGSLITAGAGISVSYDDDAGTLTISATGSGGGGGTPAVSGDFVFGVSDDDTPDPAEFTITSSDGTATLAAYSGEKYWLIGRLATEDDITSIHLDDGVIDNIGAFTKYGSTVDVSNKAYNVWVSDNSLSNADSTEIKVR